MMHELLTLVNVLYYGDTYDQLNCPALLSFELLNRRICALIDAHRVPTKPDWSSAKYYDISKSAEDVIPDSLRLHAGRKEREHNELMNGRRRGAAAESSWAYEVGAEALADEGLPGGGKGKGKAGKHAKAKAKGLAAPVPP